MGAEVQFPNDQRCQSLSVPSKHLPVRLSSTLLLQLIKDTSLITGFCGLHMIGSSVWGKK